ncbi:MAG: helix-turn-helix transcriptional regulator [Clostridia bacterium]|nr:helix-turn-helix transcriptional regulator [Clostridia bacterium]
MKTVTLSSCNPFVRAAEIHAPMETLTGLRRCYDYRVFCVFECSGPDCFLFLQDRNEKLTRGTIMVLPPETAYDFSGSMKVGLLNFDVTRECESRIKPICPPVLEAFQPSLIFDGVTVDCFSSPFIFHGGEDVIERVKEIIAEFSKGNRFSDSGTSGRVKVLLSDLCSKDREIKDAETVLADSILAYIRMNGTSISSNDEIAEHFGYNKVYLGSVLKRKKKISLHAAVLGVKISRAQYMLENTDEPVEAIAEKCGFSSRSYFCTTFKAATGYTPLKFRELVGMRQENKQ